MSLTREAILGHIDTRIGTVDVPEMGGSVSLAMLTVAEADQIRTLGEGEVPAGVKIAILCVCDDKGARLFTADDTAALMQLPASAIGAIATAALKHNGLHSEAADEAKND